MISLASRLNDTVILIKLISNKLNLDNTKITILDKIGFFFFSKTDKNIRLRYNERTRKKTTRAEIDVAIVAIKMRTPLTTIRATVTTMQRLRERNCFFLRQVYEKRKIKKIKNILVPIHDRLSKAVCRRKDFDL